MGQTRVGKWALGGAGWLPGEGLFSWTRVYTVGLALDVKYVTQFTAFQFGRFREPLYSYMCCQGDLVKEMQISWPHRIAA